MDPTDDKFDRHVSFLLQEFEGQRFPSILPRTCKETNIITSLLKEWQPDKQVIPCSIVFDVLDKELRYKQVEPQYEIVACVRVLDVLGIEVVTRETLRACLRVCTRASWRRAFLSRRLQKAKEFLLHVAAIESLPRDFRVWRGNRVCNETVLSLLVPQIRNKHMIVCFLKIAKSTLSKEHICSISRLLNVEADSRFRQCINRALRGGNWCVVDHMLRLYDMDKTTLHQVLIKAMKQREWKEVEACLERGADMATACTKTRFDLNGRFGKTNRTFLNDAMFSHFSHKDTKKEMVRALLQAGADPNVPLPSSDGETNLLCSALSYCEWDFALLLLMHNRAAGSTVSKTFRNGEPVLHFVCKKGQSELVRELFTTQTDPLATDGKGNTLIMAALGGADSKNVCRDYFSEPEPITPGSEKENVMRVLIQSGVATHQALLSQSQLRSLKQNAQNVTVDSFQSPMWQAVKRRKLRIARMLYAAGACCNEEIHELMNSEFIGHKSEETNQRDIMGFLDHISSHPRSLRDICALTISHLIGCGPQRDERAASLGLPDSLRRRVLQDHVISSDFLKDYPPDPEDTQRQRRSRGYRCGGCGVSRLSFPPRSLEPFCSCQIEEGE